MGWIKNSIKFVQESYEELKKCTWLTKKQMVASTWAVMLIVFFVGVFIFLVDRLLTVFIRMVI